MKSILLFIMLTVPTLNVHATPTCKQQVTHLKNSLENLESIILECQRNWDNTCRAAIGANREAILNGLDYASQICPVEWNRKLEKIKEKIK